MKILHFFSKIALLCVALLFITGQYLNPSIANDDLNLCKSDYRVCMLTLLMDSVVKSGNYNGVLLVAENGHVIFRKAYGKSKIDTAHKFAQTSQMQLASVSKPFTAAAIMMLKERGLLDFDDNITKYIPELRYKDITVRHLLNHSSGIPDYINESRRFKKTFYRKTWLTNDDLVEYLAKNKTPQYFKAGERHEYSNTGYALLATIVERVSGESFAEFMQKNIFDKTGMKNTFLCSPERRPKMLRDKEPLDGILGDKGIFSTVDDMFAWDRILYTNRLISQETLEEAYTESTTNKGKTFNYGYGWRIRKPEYEEPIIYHKGLWQGANPFFIRFVKCNRTVISLHPADNLNSWGLVFGINRVLNESEYMCFKNF